MGELIMNHLSRFIDDGDLLLAMMGTIFLISIFIMGAIQEHKEKMRRPRPMNT